MFRGEEQDTKSRPGNSNFFSAYSELAHLKKNRVHYPHAHFSEKPIEIQAVKWTGNNRKTIASFVKGCESPVRIDHPKPGQVMISTVEGQMIAQTGDWIIRGIHGEYYPCKPEIFEATYEQVRNKTK